MLGLALALCDKGTAGNSECMDVSLGTVPDVTADLIRKAFYPADEHVADAAAADAFSAAGMMGEGTCDLLWTTFFFL